MCIRDSGDAQERYFAAGKGSEQEVMVAGAPEYVFNEYLQVAIAFGTPAALWMMALLIGAIAAAVNAKAFGLAGAAVAVGVVMTASYPLQFPLFTVTIGVVLAGCYLCLLYTSTIRFCQATFPTAHPLSQAFRSTKTDMLSAVWSMARLKAMNSGCLITAMTLFTSMI